MPPDDLPPLTRPTLYIHIGLPKTGTTSAQVFLTLNRDRLVQHGLYYPQTSHPLFGSDWQHRFVHASIMEEFQKHDLQLEKYDFKIIDALAEEMLHKGHPKNLISEENLSWHSQLQSAVLERFSKWFDVKIIIFLRRQDQWLESYYTQIVRDGYKEPFAAIFDDIRFTTFEKLNFLELLDIWADRFGAKNLVVKRYKEDGKDTESLLMEILGLPTEGWITAPRHLDSPSLFGVRFHKALARHEKNLNYEAFFDLFDHALRDCTPGRSAVYFSREERVAFLELYSDINRKVASKYGIAMETSSDLFSFDQNAHPTQSDEINTMTDSELEVILKRLVENIRIQNRSSLDIWKAMVVAASGRVEERDVVAADLHPLEN